MTMLCLKEKVESVNFPVGADEEYKDELHAILKTISAEEDEDSESDCNMWLYPIYLVSTFFWFLVYILLQNWSQT